MSTPKELIATIIKTHNRRLGNPPRRKPVASRVPAVKARLDANIGLLADAVSAYLELNPEAPYDDLTRVLSKIRCHSRNVASAASDLGAERQREAR